MELIRFGCWSVSPYSLEWRGRADIQLIVPIQGLVKTGTNKNSILYYWPIEIAHDARFTAEDIYALNTAFFYAIDMFRAELEVPEYVLIAETIKAQQEIIDSRKTERLEPATYINGG